MKWIGVFILHFIFVIYSDCRPINDEQQKSDYFMSLGVSHLVAETGSAWVMLSIPSGEVNYGDKLKVSFKRVMQELPEARINDFIGLYFSGDDRVDSPWNWESLNANAENGTINLEANKAGEMDLRVVRPPNKILAKIPLKVWQPCPPSCYRHGACIKGKCMCQPGYALPTCSSLDPNGLSIEAFDQNMKKEMQAKLPIVAIISHVFPFEMSGNDYVGIYPASADNGTSALSWKYVTSKNVSTSTKVEIPGVKQPGTYVLRLIRNVDRVTIVESEPFVVYEYCPNRCSGHGECISGRCVCDSNWTTPDCSVGPGLVNLTVYTDTSDSTVEDFMIKQNQEVRVTFSRKYDRAYPLVISNADWIGLFDATDKDTTDPFAYQYAQVPPDEADSPLQTGEVTFMIPPFRTVDYFEFKYVRNDRQVIATTGPIPVFKPCEPQNCTGHGECEKGQCVCLPGWKGSGCEMGDVECALSFESSNVLTQHLLNVTFKRGVNDGSDSDFVGLYSQFSENNEDKLFGWSLLNTGETLTGRPNTITGQVSLSPTVSGFYKLKYVDAFTKLTKCESKLFEIFESCPLNCSSNGKCFQGVCTCESGWLAPDCRRQDAKVTITVPSRVLLGADYFQKTRFPVTINTPQGWYNPGNFIGLYPVSSNSLAPISVTSGIIVQQMAPSDTGSATIEIEISNALAPAKYQLYYVNGRDYSKITESRLIEIVLDCNEGSFDLSSNQCVCPKSKTGPRCDADTCCFEIAPSSTRGHPNDKISVTWVRPHKNGQDSDLIGLYFSNATEYSTPYAYAFAVGDGKDNGVAELTLPNLEETYTVHYVSTSNMSSTYAGPNIYVTIPCDPVDCSGNGVCLGGKCLCSSGFGGKKCDKTIPALASLTVVGGSGIVQAGSLLSINWKRTADMGDAGDYIGIYKRLESLTPYSYTYVQLNSETFEGNVQINAPTVPGTYQARWFSVQKKSVLVTSAEFDVQ